MAAAAEFGRRHAQEMILIAKKLREGEVDPAQRLGLTIVLNAAITVEAFFGRSLNGSSDSIDASSITHAPNRGD